MKKRLTKREKEINEEVKSLSFSYIFLYVATIILYVSLNSFTFYVFDMKFSYNIFILPFVFFLIDVILKEVGYKVGIKAIFVGLFIFILMNYLIDTIFGLDFNLYKYLGVAFTFFISNFVNLLIYNFMLYNFKTPLMLVILTLVFSCLIYNMFYYIVTLELNFSTFFWSSYLVVAGIETLLSCICAIVLNLVERGVD